MTATHLVETTPIEITYLDGKTETLQVGRLTIRKLYTWTHHLAADRLPELVALTVGKPVEWVDNLTDQSFADLSALCVKLNFPRAMEVGRTDPTIALKLAPVLVQFAAALRSSPFDGRTSSDLSPAPASSASPVETGSASLTTPSADSAPSSPNTPA